jgi:hypothetical protein
VATPPQRWQPKCVGMRNSRARKAAASARLSLASQANGIQPPHELEFASMWIGCFSRGMDHLRFMPTARKPKVAAKFTREWRLSPAATLGSSVRKKGIFLEVRAQLPTDAKKQLHIESGVLSLRMVEGAEAEFRKASALVCQTLDTIEDMPVLPREVEDILSIKATERHRWLKDGRLRSAGTRTVKLRGRARKITFHVFDARYIEDVLDRDLVTLWREEDAVAAAENRRRAAGKAAMKRARKGGLKAVPQSQQGGSSNSPVDGWEEFESEGLLR